MIKLTETTPKATRAFNLEITEYDLAKLKGVLRFYVTQNTKTAGSTGKHVNFSRDLINILEQEKCTN